MEDRPPIRKVCPVCEAVFWSYRNYEFCSKKCFTLQDQRTPNYVPTPEEIKEQMELIRSGRLIIKGEASLHPNWGPRDKKK